MNSSTRIRSYLLLGFTLFTVCSLAGCRTTDKVLKGDYPIIISPDVAEDLHAVYVFLAPRDMFDDKSVDELLQREQTWDYLGEFLFRAEGGTIAGWEPLRAPAPERLDHDAATQNRDLKLVVARSYLQDNKDATVLVAALFRSPSPGYVKEKIPADKMRRRGRTTIRVHEGALIQ